MTSSPSWSRPPRRTTARSGGSAATRAGRRTATPTAGADGRVRNCYAEGDGYVFMDKETFDQVTLDRQSLADQMLYLKENDDAQVVLHDGNPVGLELPPQVGLTVKETAGWLKGSSVAGQYKAATLETGLQVQVPPFIEVGEVIQIDTRTGEYLGRAR